MRTDSRSDFCRQAVLAQWKAGLLIGPASHGEGACIDHPVERAVRAGLDDGGSSVLQFTVPVFVRKRDLRFRYMSIRVPRLNHVCASLSKLILQKLFYASCTTRARLAQASESDRIRDYLTTPMRPPGAFCR